MKLYVISTQYLPLVTVNLPPKFGKKVVNKKSISSHDLLSTLNASENNELIACDNQDDALAIIALLIKGHNTTPDFIEKGVQIFAVPVIYTVEVDSAELSEKKLLTVDELLDYADTRRIPLYQSAKETQHSDISLRFKDQSKEINIHRLNKSQFKAVTHAIYLNSSLTEVKDVNLRPVTQRISLFVQGIFSQSQTNSSSQHTSSFETIK